jgi:hypothetical protein
MRNLLDTKWSQFINAPPKNPTQTQYTRFLEKPGGVVTSQFTKTQQDFESAMSDALKTKYTPYLENTNDGRK